ncbi:hypothetical protein ACIRQY_35230 [Streptomyces sp. NPDC101490]|uniref:hypothetical protein n=1 Tax=Streptomyces sp. NPDC101490 TaxID=3366143 RepID=UPI00380CAF35
MLAELEGDGWQREGCESHVGGVGVLLADGSEPGPVYIDLGSGATVHSSTAWWLYDGSRARPLAASMRGRCACGWRATATYRIDWETAPTDEAEDEDLADFVSGPHGDWSVHLDDVAARTVQLPDDLALLLTSAKARIGQLADAREAALVLRAAGELEEIIAAHAPVAARVLAHEDRSGVMPRTAEALGLTEEAARARLRHYDLLTGAPSQGAGW